jgi:hypothetical protein
VNPFRVYEPSECGTDGYPLAWHDLGDGKGDLGEDLTRAETLERLDELLGLELAGGVS